jgi:hypothetical protein
VTETDWERFVGIPKVTLKFWHSASIESEKAGGPVSEFGRGPGFESLRANHSFQGFTAVFAIP